MSLLAIVLAFVAIGIDGRSTGPPGCLFPSSTYMSASQNGTGNFTITLTEVGSSDPITQIEANGLVNVTLSAPMPYKGFIIQASSGSTPFQNTVGGFVGLDFPSQYVACNSIANGAVGHNYTRAKAPRMSDSFIWQAPSTAANVTFFSAGVYNKTNWFGSNNHITAMLEVVANNETVNATITTTSMMSKTTETEKSTTEMEKSKTKSMDMEQTETPVPTPTKMPGGDAQKSQMVLGMLLFIPVLLLIF